MGWAEKRSNGRYRAVWRDEAGNQKSLAGFLRKAEAERYAASQETNIQSGGPSSSSRGMTWSAWCVEWQKGRMIEATTADAEHPRIARWVEPRWGRVPISKITRRDVQAWVAELSEEMAPASVAKVYRILSRSLADAVDDQRLAVNPCDGRVVLPVVAPGGDRYLTREEVDRVLAQIAEPYRTAVILLVGTGMRFGEMAGLHWSRVDTTALHIDIVDTWTSAAGQIKPYPKGRRLRRVPIEGWLAEALGPRPSATSCGIAHARGSRCRSDLVVTGPRSAPLDAGNFRARHWMPALAHSGVGVATLHDLRHTYASWLLQAGASLSELAEVLGHSSIAVTQRYAHLAPNYADRIRALMDASRAAHVAAVGGPEIGDAARFEAS